MDTIKASGTIEKSPNDDREYRFIKLDNGLRVVMVKDQETTTSAAAMQVEVGSALNPEEYPGLAHFLEHMLFMGTEKYPDEEIYSKHCSDFGGYDNAYTGLEMTNYHFEVSNEGFDKALDMFAQFFICPLFSKDAVDREMNAVDSENNKNLQSDMWRFFQLLQDQSNPESVLNRFATGNLATLKKDGVVEALKEFHKKWYSSNIMNLVVYSNKELDDIEKMVRDLFSQVENKNVEVPSFADPPCYPQDYLGYLYKIKPVMNKHNLKFHWFYPCYEQDIYYKVMDILSHVLGHEGENSLCSYLVHEDLATELSTYADHELSAFSHVCLDITLTDKGLKEYERIIEIVYQAIHTLKKEGPVDHVYEECSKNHELKWEFLDKSRACGFATNFVARMHLFGEDNMHEIYSTKYLYKDFDKKEYQKVLDGLTPQNSNIYLRTQEAEKLKPADQEFQKEKWYGTEFTKEKFSDDLMKRMENPSVSESEKKLSNPVRNTLFPDNLDVLPANEEESKTVKMVHTNDFSDVWFKKSDKFKTPKVCASCLIYTNNSGYNISVEGGVFVSLWLEVIEDYYREFTYMAEMASMDYRRSNAEGCLQFDFRGYSASLGEFIEQCFEKLSQFKASEYKQAFESRKAKVLREMKNFAFRPPYAQTMLTGKNIILSNEYPVQVQLEALEKLDFDRFVGLSNEFLTSGRISWFFNGNLDAEYAKKIASKAHDALKYKSIPKSQLIQVRTLALPEGQETSLVFEAVNKDETNSSILSYFQDGPKQSIEHGLYHSIAFQLLDQPAFDYLRTKLQLGYIAYARPFNYRDTVGGGFIVQSNVRSPEGVLSKINEFLSKQKERFDSLSDEEFTTAVNAVLMEKKEIDMSLMAETLRLFREVVKHTYQFDIKEREIEALTKFADSSNADEFKSTKQKVIDHFNNLFFNNIKQFNVELVASGHSEDSQKTREENTTGMKVERSQISLDDVSVYKNRQMLYPDQYLTKFADYTQ